MSKTAKIYDYQVALEESTNYFGGDDLAANVFINKYALRNHENELVELTPLDMHRRMAKEFARIEKSKFKNPLSYDTIFGLFDNFKYICPQGSPMYGIGNNYKVISLSNCYVLDIPEDSYNSILDIDKQLVNISKRRGGVGIDLSKLRPSGSPTKNAAKTSTGIVSWMRRYSNSIREVGQNNRRGALMLTLSVHHPDVLDFATIKNDDREVTGANISIRLTKEFLDALNNDEEYELRFPVDDKSSPQISKMVSAKKVWDTIIHSAWLRAEPGLMMWDNIINNGPADIYERYRSVSSNPCIPAWSTLLTKNGIKELKDLNIGDEIWSKEGWTKILNKWSTGIKPVYKYKTNGFSEFLAESAYFVGTIDHKIVSNGEKISIDKATSIDFFNDDSADGPTFDMTMMSAEIIDVEYLGEQEVFDITVDNKTHTFWNNGVDVSNCSELTLCSLDSCRLLVLVLLSYVKNPFRPDAYFDYELFYDHAKIAQRLMDDLVDLESEKIEQILAKIDSDPEPESVKSQEREMWQKIKLMNDEGRRTGTGITAIGDMLAALGIGYGTEESIKVVEKVYETLKLACYEESVNMAQELGSFVGYDAGLEEGHPFIERIKAARPDIYNRMIKYGRRNVSLTTTAPTGSVSILTRTTSGIEPLFTDVPYTRRKKINHDDAHQRVDFVDDSGDKWQNFTVYHPTIKIWMEQTGETDYTKSPWHGHCAESIDWINRVKLQAAAQRHVCHAISSTINLPNNVTEDVIGKIYRAAFESGCKGITVYRDGCRSGVLIKDDSAAKATQSNKTAIKRPRDLKCDVHHTTVGGKHYLVLVGLDETGNPYEVFACKNGASGLDKSIDLGIIRRQRENFYKAIFGNPDSDDSIELAPITASMTEMEEVISRLVSGLLRAGADMNFIVRQLEKTGQGKEMTSFSKAVARCLKKYIPDGTIVEGEKCPDCKSKLIRQDGCAMCMQCGFSRCQ